MEQQTFKIFEKGFFLLDWRIPVSEPLANTRNAGRTVQQPLPNAPRARKASPTPRQKGTPTRGSPKTCVRPNWHHPKGIYSAIHSASFLLAPLGLYRAIPSKPWKPLVVERKSQGFGFFFVCPKAGLHLQNLWALWHATSSVWDAL